MSLTFKTQADTANGILKTRLTGFISSMDEYQAWEEEFARVWQENFGQQKIKILSDQRGFRPTQPEVFERATELRKQIRGRVIAATTVVDDPIAALQLKRMSGESEYDDVEKFFDDPDKALEWLKAQ